MKAMKRILLATVCCVGIWAQDEHGHDQGIVPGSEHATESARATAGPREHRGVGAEAIGAILLREVPELAERQVRARVITIAPGGHVAVHEHSDRPGFAYILSGQAVERRVGDQEPTTLGPGEVAFEKDGVVHWWHNPGEEPVRALVVDMVPVEE